MGIRERVSKPHPRCGFDKPDALSRNLRRQYLHPNSQRARGSHSGCAHRTRCLGSTVAEYELEVPLRQ